MGQYFSFLFIITLLAYTLIVVAWKLTDVERWISSYLKRLEETSFYAQITEMS
jgi:hypothetical protein